MANRIRTKSIDVPENKKGFIIGRDHSGLKEISRVTKAKVFVSDESGKICANGTDEQIKLAEKMIQDKLDQNVDVKVHVPKEFIGLVIGRRGESLKRIEKQTQTKICLSSKQIENGREIGVFTITGSSENCHKAEDLIREVVNQNQPAEGNVDVEVPQEFIGLVIGREGENIKRIQMESQTTIHYWSKKIEDGREIAVFTITGSPENRQKATDLITEAVGMISRVTKAEVFVSNESGKICAKGTDEQIKLAEKMIQDKLNQNQPAEGNVEVEVPQEFAGLVIGRGGENIKQIQMETQTTINHWSKNLEDGREIEVFTITGSPENRQKAKDLITEFVEKKNDDITVVEVESKFTGLVIGKGGRTLRNIRTKSETEIRSPSKENRGVGGYDKFIVIGSPEKRKRAEALIREVIVSCKESMLRKQLGGDRHFAIFNQKYENVDFVLKKDESNVPKLDAFMKGERYRIEIEPVCDSVQTTSNAGRQETGRNFKEKNDDTTISTVQNILLTSLRHLLQVKDEDEEKLKMDLWCHLGRVFVHNVDEGEKQEGLQMDYVTQRIENIAKNVDDIPAKEDQFSEHEFKNDDGWKVTFEEGIDPNYNEALELLAKDDGGQDPILSHSHTQWRYDYAFTTPSGRYVRFKLWELLKECHEPPPEVKNLIKPVFVKGHEESVVAWLCYPSTTIVRGEIMTPSSKYDCRLKLRAGRRFAPEEEDFAEENKILCEYLSRCELDHTGECRHLRLPCEPPPGFTCPFYRSAQERISTSDGTKETFTVIVLDEVGWDSDSSERRNQKQFGVRVVLDSWSKELLSGEWEPETIVGKLPEFMDFFHTFRDMLLGQE